MKLPDGKSSFKYVFDIGAEDDAGQETEYYQSIVLDLKLCGGWNYVFQSHYRHVQNSLVGGARTAPPRPPGLGLSRGDAPRTQQFFAPRPQPDWRAAPPVLALAGATRRQVSPTAPLRVSPFI